MGSEHEDEETKPPEPAKERTSLHKAVEVKYRDIRRRLKKEISQKNEVGGWTRTRHGEGDSMHGAQLEVIRSSCTGAG